MDIRKLVSMILIAAAVFSAPQALSRGDAFADDGALDEVHYLAFASDRHDNAGAIEAAFSGMPAAEDASVEYVCVMGDMVGSGNDSVGESEEESEPDEGELGEKAPAYDTSMIYDEVREVGFRGVDSPEDMSILWGDHDANATDDAGIMFADKGEGSGLMKEGLNSDGSTAYYIYGIAFYDMKEKARAEAAAEEFMDWIDTLEDNTVPVIVLCHIPLHYARKDNLGAAVWSDALNYAATGEAAGRSGATVIRDVVYLHGHNHTNEYSSRDPENPYSGEFYIPRGAAMAVGDDESLYKRIYYTYTTAGYLKDDPKATLIIVDGSGVGIKKYHDGEVQDGLYDSESKSSGDFATKFMLEGSHEIARVLTASDISAARMENPGEEYVYTGEEIRPEPVIMLGDEVLSRDSYWIRYKDNINAGTAKMIISGKASKKARYSGALTIEFTISKAKNPAKISAGTKTVRYSALKKAKKLTAPLTVRNAAGTVRYSRVSGSKKLAVSSKSGKITVKKGTKKGTYTIKVKIAVKGDANHLPLTKKKTVKIRVK